MQCVLDGKAIPIFAVVIVKTKASLKRERDPIEVAVRASEIDQAILAITCRRAR